MFYNIQDKLKFEPKNQKLLRLNCYFCQNPHHLINKCPHAHFYPDYEKVIKFSEFPRVQSRISMIRNPRKKIKWTRLKKCPLMSLTLKDDPLEEMSSSKSKEELPPEEPDMETSIHLLQKAKIAKVNKGIKEVQSQFKSIPHIPPINKTYFDNSPNKLFKKERNPWEPSDSEENIGIQIKNKLISILPKDSYQIFEKPMEFKKYNPEKNLSSFQSNYEKHRVMRNKTKRKDEILHKISKYSFRLESMYNEITGQSQQIKKVLNLKNKERNARAEYIEKKFSLSQLKTLKTMRKRSFAKRLLKAFCLKSPQIETKTRKKSNESS